MVNICRITLVTLLAILLVLSCGVAGAITVRVDKIQANGYYIGTPTVIDQEKMLYGYSYNFVPSGSYVINGSISNDEKSDVIIYISPAPGVEIAYNVPAVGVLDYKFSFNTPSRSDINVTWYRAEGARTQIPFSIYNQSEAAHDIDMGPMSDMSVIYNSGHLTSSLGVMHSVNLTWADLRQMYFGGSFNFQNSPLYSFAE